MDIRVPLAKHGRDNRREENATRRGVEGAFDLNRGAKLETTGSRWTIRDRLLATLRGDKPNRPPFIDRLEIWYKCHTKAGTIPPELQGSR